MLGNGGNTFKTGFVPKSCRLSAMVQLVREIATPSISLFRSKAKSPPLYTRNSEGLAGKVTCSTKQNFKPYAK